MSSNYFKFEPIKLVKFETDYDRGYRAGQRNPFLIDLRTDYQKGFEAGKKAANPFLFETDYDRGYRAGQRDGKYLPIKLFKL